MQLKQKLKDAMPLIIMVTFALVCFLVLQLTGVIEHIDISALSEWVRTHGWLGAFIYILAYTFRPLIFFLLVC